MKSIGVFLILIFFTSIQCYGSDKNICRELHFSIIESSLNLSFEDFDQTSQSGWRILESSECYIEASSLIESYGLQNGFNDSLRWHQLQMNAMAGNYPEAIRLGNSILQSDINIDTKSSFLWGDYVLGTIAFLKRDKKTLLIQRNNLAVQSDFRPNAMNFAVLDRLYNNFDSTYADAYKGTGLVRK